LTDVELVLAAYSAAPHVPVGDEDRNAALRRALFVYASGGDLYRDPTLDEPAVLELARDLDSPGRRDALLAALPSPFDADPERAWRAYACALLAEAIAED
jgi:hypothetical protein